MKKRIRSAIAKSRTSPPPEIFVKSVQHDTWHAPFCRAHLRNKKGYIYLQWRDGERVRSLYLGKAPRKCPTDRDQVQLAGAGADRGGPGARTAPTVRQRRRRPGRR